MKKISNSTVFFYLTLAAILGGGMSTFVKVAVNVVPPIMVTFIRFFISALVLLPFAIKSKSKIDRNFFYKAVPISILATANVSLFAFGVKLTSATVSQLLYTIVPVLVAIFSYVVLREKVSTRKIVGIMLGLVGVAIIILFPVFNGESSLKGSILGNLMIFAGVLSFSVYSVLSKPLQERYSPVLLTTTFAITTTFIFLPFAYREYLSRSAWIGNVDTIIIVSLLYVGVVGGLYYFLYQHTIKRGSPLIASTILFLQPAATYVWAFVLLAERLTLSIVLGAVLAIGGAWLVTRSKK